MTVNIHFDTDNASFEDSFLMETTRVLRSCKEALIDSNNETEIRRSIMDSNGNRIGSISISNAVNIAWL